MKLLWIALANGAFVFSNSKDKDKILKQLSQEVPKLGHAAFDVLQPDWLRQLHRMESDDFSPETLEGMLAEEADEDIKALGSILSVDLDIPRDYKQIKGAVKGHLLQVVHGIVKSSKSRPEWLESMVAYGKSIYRNALTLPSLIDQYEGDLSPGKVATMAYLMGLIPDASIFYEGQRIKEPFKVFSNLTALLKGVDLMAGYKSSQAGSMAMLLSGSARDTQLINLLLSVELFHSCSNSAEMAGKMATLIPVGHGMTFIAKHPQYGSALLEIKPRETGLLYGIHYDDREAMVIRLPREDIVSILGLVKGSIKGFKGIRLPMVHESSRDAQKVWSYMQIWKIEDRMVVGAISTICRLFVDLRAGEEGDLHEMVDHVKTWASLFDHITVESAQRLLTELATFKNFKATKSNVEKSLRVKAKAALDLMIRRAMAAAALGIN